MGPCGIDGRVGVLPRHDGDAEEDRRDRAGSGERDQRLAALVEGGREKAPFASRMHGPFSVLLGLASDQYISVHTNQCKDLNCKEGQKRAVHANQLAL